jgi:hypothetical protein
LNLKHGFGYHSVSKVRFDLREKRLHSFDLSVGAKKAVSQSIEAKPRHGER